MKALKIIIILIGLLPSEFYGQCYTTTIITTPPSCPTCCDGSVDFVSITGGCPPYAYVWSNGNTGPGTGMCFDSTVTLTIYDAGQCCPDTSFVFRISSTTDINELNKTSFSIYPNPSTGIITLQQEKIYNEEVSVTIFSVLGKQVYYQENNNNIINIIHLDNGVYYLQLTDKNNKRIVYEKITLQK